MTYLPKRSPGDRPVRLLGLSKAILDALIDRFVARTTDLYRLVPQRARKRKDHEREIRAALKRLRECIDPREKKDNADRKWGFIRSVSWSDPTVESKIEYTVLVHGLTNRGLQVARESGLDPERRGRSFQEFSVERVDHELRLNDFLDLARAELATAGFELIAERTNLRRSTVAPDALLYTYDPRVNMRSAPIFVEYEKQKRGKYDDGKPQVVRKVEAYAAYYNSDLCQTEFGFRKFYLLIILRTDRKVDFLLRDVQLRNLTLKVLLVASESALCRGVMRACFRTTEGNTRSFLDL